MTLERGIAVLFLAFCVAYGYTAFVTMQDELLPFELGMAFLPNSLPKVLSVAGALAALFVIIGARAPGDAKGGAGTLDLASLQRTHILQAVSLLGAMAAYAVLLRPIGFIGSTALFLSGAALILGERRIVRLLAISIGAAFAVWVLVEKLLDIVLRPWPDPALLALFAGQ